MYNKDFDSLNSGAPDIKITGNQRMASYGYDDAMGESRQAYDDARKRGVIPMDMEFEEFLDMMQGGGFLEGRRPQKNQQMASMEAGQEGTLEDIYADLIAQGFSPREAAKRAKELYNNMQQDMAQGGRAGIMAAAPGTYTQKRKDNMMAYGGIAGADGRKRYGLGSLFQKAKDKFVDDIIPNEIKENPLLTAALVGGSTKFLPEGMGQGWLGDLLSKAEGVPILGDIAGGMQTAGTGITDLINKIPGVNLPGGSVVGRNMLGDLDPNNVTGWIEKGLTMSPTEFFTDYVSSKLPGSNQHQQQTTQTGTEKYPINWQGPLAIGTAIGAADYLTRSDDTMPEQLSIDPSRFKTAAAAMADEDLRFKPETQYAL